ncbi:hypothetical protein [Nocardiopsis trehalosi]|uniref:hypothetical protein n=1 Tax=Nocardiopsis trehalosi TaxID=109329 RepID=UPI00082DFFC5|nr:hypothetical protein [Nocardiopsis trehalosi]
MGQVKAALAQEDLRVRVVRRRVRTGNRELTIVRPEPLLRCVALYRRNDDEWRMSVDRPDGRRLAALFLLAARSSHSLIHLPTRSAALAPAFDDEHEVTFDLVLAPRALQFRPGHWKRVRQLASSRANSGSVTSVSPPLADLPEPGPEMPLGLWPYQYQELMARQQREQPSNWQRPPRIQDQIQAETLFLTGDPMDYRAAARDLVDLTVYGPPHAQVGHFIPGGCHYHICRDLGPWDGAHVEYAPSWAH